tara:strand:- start:372 stop:983 length:612 start_codon:yes stop_codon:yes gene_type:complete
MKSVVLIQRDLLGGTVSQNNQTEMFSATDLVRIGNKWRIANEMQGFDMSAWFQTKGTKEFMTELEGKFGTGEVKKAARGRGKHTWVHPLLFIDMALAINPRLKVEVYEWLFDQLIKYRNESGDSYKAMCGCLFAHAKNKVHFYQYVQEVAKKIKMACCVTDWNEANEDQLRLRDKLHNNIGLLADVLNNNDEAVRLAILKGIV